MNCESQDIYETFKVDLLSLSCQLCTKLFVCTVSAMCSYLCVSAV